MSQISSVFRCAALLLVVLTTTASQAAHVNWLTDVEPALKTANESGKLVLLKFTADWCGYCKKMERETFERPAVAGLVNEQFVPVLVDADKYQALVKHLKISGLPAIMIVSPDMVILKRITGYQTEEKLLPMLQATLAQNPTQVPQMPQVAAVTAAASNAPTRTVSAHSTAPNANANPFAVSEQPPTAAFEKPAFGGLCLLGVSETRTLINGMPAFAMKYRGKTLHFSSQQMLQKFQDQPALYWPMKDGACPVTLAETGQLTEGRLEYAAMFRDKLWFTSSPDNMKKFVSTPARYADAGQGR